MIARFTLHLARHLSTVPLASGLLDRAQFAAVLARDPERSVVLGAPLGPGLLDAALASDRLVSSTLRRAEQTVAVLEVALGSRCPPTERWADLVEAGQPALGWPAVRLPQGVWSAASRTAWTVGVSGDRESRSSAAERARRVAERFEALAAPGVVVTVVAHGCFNVVLARELRTRGWRGPILPDVRPAHFSTYRLA